MPWKSHRGQREKGALLTGIEFHSRGFEVAVFDSLSARFPTHSRSCQQSGSAVPECRHRPRGRHFHDDAAVGSLGTIAGNVGERSPRATQVGAHARDHHTVDLSDET
jgi:hypothetical protein